MSQCKLIIGTVHRSMHVKSSAPQTLFAKEGSFLSGNKLDINRNDQVINRNNSATHEACVINGSLEHLTDKMNITRNGD